MPASGELEKMKIYAYNNPELSESHRVGAPFVALINPETYSIETKMEFNLTQGHGTTGQTPKFLQKPPEEMSFEFLFDNTGILDGQPVENLKSKLQTFQELLMGYDSSTHEPKFFKLAWGTLIFKGRCTALNINYKLFNPDGSPIRAICKVTFKEFKEDNVRVAEDGRQSPDLTHIRTVKQGDTLPNLCFSIYGNSIYYMEVARVNRLINFRKLKVGQQLFFPPIDKTTN